MVVHKKWYSFDIDPGVHKSDQWPGVVPLYELHALLYTSAIQKFATIEDTGDPMAKPCFCLFEIGVGEAKVQQDTDLIRSEVGSVVQ